MSASGEGTLPSLVQSGLQRKCENADCNVDKLVGAVPRRKTTQFITDPEIMDKPMLINGFTTVFQVDGAAAKMSDLKNTPGVSSSTEQKQIYRIVPNTHAHIVNYVVVDADGESLKKINENDPATMRKLLNSQKTSADQMLKKLMAGQGAIVTTKTAAANTNVSSGTPVVQPTVRIRPMAAPVQTPKLNILRSAAPQNSAVIQLPVRMHPNLKITSVSSGETVAAMGATVSSNITGPTTSAVLPSVLPFIQPVPLANLQSPSPMPATTFTNTIPPINTTEKPIFDKMQSEIQELRRTVAQLAEAQAKTLRGPEQPNQLDAARRGNKRPKQ